jgi:hypothetical protein
MFRTGLRVLFFSNPRAHILFLVISCYFLLFLVISCLLSYFRSLTRAALQKCVCVAEQRPPGNWLHAIMQQQQQQQQQLVSNNVLGRIPKFFVLLRILATIAALPG